MSRKLSFIILIFLFLVFFFLMQSIQLLTSNPSQDFEEIEISFSEPEFFKNGAYDFVRVHGASFMTDVGKPMLPVKGIQVLVEDREIDHIEVVSSDSETLKGYYFIQPVQYLSPE